MYEVIFCLIAVFVGGHYFQVVEHCYIISCVAQCPSTVLYEVVSCVVQRLSTETDRLKGDKELLEQKIHDISVDGGVAGDVKADEEVAALQQRLKVTIANTNLSPRMIKISGYTKKKKKNNC